MTHSICVCGDHAWRPASLGLVAIMDVAVAPSFDAWRLFGHHKKKSSGRIYSRIIAYLGKRKGGTGKNISLGRAILNADGIVDHIDNDPTNNKLSNLRPVTIAQNNANRRGTSLSGAKGVTFARGGYQVACAHKYVGRFKTLDEASAAYQKRAEEVWGSDFVNTKLNRTFALMTKQSEQGEDQ